MTRLYLPLPLHEGARVELPDEALRHLVQVLRMQAGEALTVFNGEGGEYAAVLDAVSRKAATLRIGAHDHIPRRLQFRSRTTAWIDRNRLGRIHLIDGLREFRGSRDFQREDSNLTIRR